MQNAGVKTLLIATRNNHKVGEIRTLLGGGYRYLTLRVFPDAPEVVEDRDTFAGNAAKKAEELASWLRGERERTRQHLADPAARLGRGQEAPETQSGATLETAGLLVVADDSGLEVDALDGAPGVFSARYAALESGGEGNSPDGENNARLLRELAGVSPENRSARFRCVIAVVEVDRLEEGAFVFDGACEGRIQDQANGDGGFGYDPLFVPEGFEESFAELGEETKNQLSHRARALEKLKPWLDAQPG